MKLIIILSTTIWFLPCAPAFCQNAEKVFFKLEKGKYQKGVQEMPATGYTKRDITIYTFTIPCSCIGGGSLNFFNHNNPETGTIFEPVRTIDKKQLKDLKFIGFDDLVALMKKNDIGFNKKYTLYFVETGGKNYLYHVYKGSSFADYDVDVIYLDSAGQIMNEIH